MFVALHPKLIKVEIEALNTQTAVIMIECSQRPGLEVYR